MKHSIKVSFFVCIFLGWVIWHYQFLSQFTLVDTRAFLGLLAQIAATMLGFLLAALSILASISGQRLVRTLKNSGHYQVLLKRFFINSIAYGVAAVVALIAYMANEHSIRQATILACSGFIFASLLLVDVGWRFWLVLSSLDNER